MVAFSLERGKHGMHSLTVVPKVEVEAMEFRGGLRTVDPHTVMATSGETVEVRFRPKGSTQWTDYTVISTGRNLGAHEKASAVIGGRFELGL